MSAGVEEIGMRVSRAPKKFEISDAIEVAGEVVDVLRPHCERIIVAGSIRRRQRFVSDVEILFVPKLFVPEFRAGVRPDRTDLFLEPPPVPPAPLINQVERALNELLKLGLIGKRLNRNNLEAWGEKNKLGVHVPSGMAVDFFTATPESWFNYLVCRTGPSESNIRICEAAITRGWKWNPYGNGFSRPNGLGFEHHDVKSEQEVFAFVGLPYKEPWER